MWRALAVILLVAPAGCLGAQKVDTGTPPLVPVDSAAWDTGTTWGTTTTTTTPTPTDSGGPAAGCDPHTAVIVLAETTGVSPYATQLLPDMDGGGRPELVFEADDPRALDVLRGEDLVAGSRAPWFSVVATDLSQAGMGVGSAGDLDGDGIAELALAESGDEEAFLSVSGAADPGTPLFAVQLVDRADGYQFPFPTVPADPAPDLWGDGLPDVVVGVAAGLVWSELRVFDGTTRGAPTRDDARLVVAGSVPGAYPSVSPDLDADGVDELVYTAGATVLLVSPGLSGVLSTADLDAVLTLEVPSEEVEAFDVDDDGLPEWFVYNPFASRDTLVGIGGVVLADAVRTGVPADRGDRWVSVSGDGYLGKGGSRVVSNADCAPGLAVTAHFDDAVRVIDHATLVAGGAVDADTLPSLRGAAGSWFGYGTGGSRDVDGDGTLDLIVASASAPSTTTLFLGAGLQAK